jgi:hypothetical protein
VLELEKLFSRINIGCLWNYVFSLTRFFVVCCLTLKNLSSAERMREKYKKTREKSYSKGRK